MSAHTLALIVLGLMLAGEGYALAERKPSKFTYKSIISVPLAIGVYWLLATILL